MQTSSGGVQFVDQGQIYKLCPATAGLKAVCSSLASSELLLWG